MGKIEEENITRAVRDTMQQAFAPWLNAGMDLPNTSVKELSRISGLPSQAVLEAVLRGNVLVSQGPSRSIPVIKSRAIRERDEKEALAMIKSPKNSAYAVKTAAFIWSEGQRYQRRFLFPKAGESGKPTRKRIAARVSLEQIAETKITFVPYVRNDAQKNKPTSQRPRASGNGKEKTTMDSIEQKTENAFQVLMKANQLDAPLARNAIWERVRTGIIKNGQVDFLQFTCPRIDAKKLLGEDPETYILTDPTNNNFDTSCKRLTALLSQLQNVGVMTKVNIIIGDSDEEEYIFPVTGQPRLNAAQCTDRRNQYRNNFTSRLARKYPELLFQVYSWRELQNASPPFSLSLPASEEDISTEMQRMKSIFSKGNYYEGVIKPTIEQLRQITELKFASYAKQGLVLSHLFPTAILIQNEFPQLLRTRMLNSANGPDQIIPAIYPYNRKDSPYEK